jgi:hypothetical protein
MKWSCLFLFSLFFPNLSWAPPFFSSSEETGVLENKSSLSFAHSLEEEGDLYRAITEYKRIVFWSKDQNIVRNAHLGMVRCYYLGRKWQALEHASQKALKISSWSFREKIEISIARAIALWNLNRARQAAELLESLPEKNLLEKEKRIKAWILLSAGRQVEAERLFSETGHVEVLEKLRGPGPRRKSPVSAAWMSTFLPGAGQLYCDRPKAALGAFVINGLLLAGTLEAFHEDQDALGYALGMLTLTVWTSNVYGAVNFAVKDNRENFSNKDLWLAREMELGSEYKANISWNFSL